MERRIINTNERDMISTLGMRSKLNPARISLADYDRLLVQYEHRGPFTYALLYEHEAITTYFHVTYKDVERGILPAMTIDSAVMSNRTVKFLSVGTSKRSYTDKNNPATGEAVAFQRAILNAFGLNPTSAVRFTSTKG